MLTGEIKEYINHSGSWSFEPLELQKIIRGFKIISLMRYHMGSL